MPCTRRSTKSGCGASKKEPKCPVTYLSGPYDEDSLLCKIAELKEAIQSVSKVSVEVPKACAGAVRRRRASVKEPAFDMVFADSECAPGVVIDVPKKVKRTRRRSAKARGCAAPACPL